MSTPVTATDSSVTWVVNGNSKHEISSKEHLLQVMTQGSLYTDAGSPPPAYWSADYEQTVDIDLGFDVNITPIGTDSASFGGSYDGAGHSISNWSYVDDPDVTGRFSALFGSCAYATLENMRLTGVWTLTAIGDALQAGFLAGRMLGGTLRNIDCVFDEGTYLSCTLAETLGACVGECMSASVYSVTVAGTIGTADWYNNGCSGGVIGRVKRGNVLGLRNLATWPGGISGRYVGGIIGHCEYVTVVAYLVNAMTGDINASSTGGGIIGLSRVGTDSTHTMVNSMRGNITGVGSSAGGILGTHHGRNGPGELAGAMNYMTGNIVRTNGTSAGLIGHAYKDLYYKCTVSNSIVAMNGSSDEAVIGTTDYTDTVSSVTAKIDTAFGFTYTAATYGSTTDVFTGTASTLFPGLYYIPLTFSDNASNSYEYDMVFGNVGGSPSGTQINATAGPVSLRMSWPAVSGATAYQVGFSLGLPGDNPVTKRAETLSADAASYTITNLDPETTYSLYLYYSTDDLKPSELLGTESFETLEDIATNYTTATFADDSGVIDFRKLDKNTLARVKAVMNEVLTTGTQIQLPGGGRGARAMKKAMFVKTGEAIAVEPDIKIAFAFEETGGAGQSATLNMSDDSTVDVSFDETNKKITIGGVAYNEGDTFVLDNQKVTVMEV